jgi:hypothetical protein
MRNVPRTKAHGKNAGGIHFRTNAPLGEPFANVVSHFLTTIMQWQNPTKFGDGEHPTAEKGQKSAHSEKS